MSGPLRNEDAQLASGAARVLERSFEIVDSRVTEVASLPIRRALPQRGHRTVGSWCFADHMGPVTFGVGAGPDIGPHPHMGLQTVTWLLSGELVHRDSLASEQPIKPGQLNLMTAGLGVTHAEETGAPFEGEFHGLQLWVAQPESTRNGEPAFEYHDELPQVELSEGAATVLVGTFAGAASPARHDSDHVGVDLDLRGTSALLPLPMGYEHALIVLSGAIQIEGRVLEPGHLAYFGTGRDELPLKMQEPTRAMLLGGVPFDETVLMWWNFVARNRDEMIDAYRHWSDDDGFFGQVRSRLPRIPVGPPPWLGNP
jgi:redox-sensitive bicupin YhaK (pirin superfamily)